MQMDKAQGLQTIRDVGIIPVVRAQSAAEAMKAIDAIREGGVSLLEITMTVPGAVGVIEEVARARCSTVKRRGRVFWRARSSSSALHSISRRLRYVVVTVWR